MDIIEFTKKYIYEDFLMKGNTYFINLKLMKILAYIITPIILAIITFYIASLKDPQTFYAWSQFTARTAFFLLIFLLYLKPLMKILPNIGLIRKLIIYRRQLGIATFYFAFFHMVNALFMYLDRHPIIDTLIYFKYGLISILVLFVMYLTSNNFSVRLLKRNWKKVQGLVHISIGILFVHMFMVYAFSFKKLGVWGGFWDAFSFTFYIFLYYVLKAFEYFKVSYNFPPKLENKVTPTQNISKKQ